MREIKFRAWDKKKKKMQYSGFLLNAIGEPINYKGEDQDVILMQFTGLKDKNGKEEVYQDDLMKDLLHIYRVVWMECSARFLLIDVKEYMNQLSAEAIKLLPKIGNIYENPELMENENEIA